MIRRERGWDTGRFASSIGRHGARLHPIPDSAEAEEGGKHTSGRASRAAAGGRSIPPGGSSEFDARHPRLAFVLSSRGPRRDGRHPSTAAHPCSLRSLLCRGQPGAAGRCLLPPGRCVDMLTGGPASLTDELHQAALHDRALPIGEANLADLILGGSLAVVAGSRGRLMFRPPLTAASTPRAGRSPGRCAHSSRRADPAARRAGSCL